MYSEVDGMTCMLGYKTANAGCCKASLLDAHPLIRVLLSASFSFPCDASGQSVIQGHAAAADDDDDDVAVLSGASASELGVVRVSCDPIH